MREILRKVETYQVDMLCNHCSIGFMCWSDLRFDTDEQSTEYLHTCDYCGNEKPFKLKYPFIQYKVLDE